MDEIQKMKAEVFDLMRNIELAQKRVQELIAEITKLEREARK
jgi:peptidoglycan hydrolase CwlO-like protein